MCKQMQRPFYPVEHQFSRFAFPKPSNGSFPHAQLTDDSFASELLKDLSVLVLLLRNHRASFLVVFPPTSSSTHCLLASSHCSLAVVTARGSCVARCCQQHSIEMRWL